MTTPAPVSENREPVVSTTSTTPNQPPPSGGSQHAVGTKIPTTLADWKTGLENVLQQPEDSNTATELSNLLRPQLVDKLAGKSKGDYSFDDAFSELLFKALEDGKQTFAALFINDKYFKWNHKYGEDQATALHQAVENDQKEAAIKILQHYHGAVDECDKYGRTPLHYAAQWGSKDFTTFLLHNNADVDAPDSQYLTPLHIVAWNPEEKESDILVDIATELLDNGAEVNTRDVFGETPLHDAAKRGDHEVMKLLLQRGGDVECRNFEGQVPQDVLPTTTAVSPEALSLLQRPIDKGDSHSSHPIPTRLPQCWNSAPSESSCEAGSTSTNDTRRDICKNLYANVRFFYRDQGFSWSWSVSIHGLLHNHADGGTMKTLEAQFVDLVFDRLETKDEIETKKIETTKDEIRGKIWRWIHLPANQMSWVTELVWCLTVNDNGPAATEEQPQKRKEAWEFLERNIAQRKGVKPRSFVRVPHAGDMLKNATDQKSSTTLAEISESSTSNESAKLYRREIWRGKSKFSGDQKFSLVVPYIDFETEQYLQRHDKVDGQYKIDTRRFRNMRELEHRSLNYNELSGLHKPQTLDESYYDMLPDEGLRIRDRDQVVFKWFEHIVGKAEQENFVGATDIKTPTEPEAKLKSKPSSATTQREFGLDTMDASRLPRLVMVHQLWLWKLDKDTVITAFPDRYHQGIEDTLFDTIRQSGIEWYTKPEQLIENILFESVTFLEEFRYAGLGIHLLDIFESSIATRSDQEARYFKEFRDSVKKTKRLLHQKVDEEISLIYEIKDIRDELHLILRIFETQRDIVKKFAGVFWPDETDAKMRRAFVEDCGIENIIDRTMALDKHAQRSLEGVDYLVQMKQAQSSLGEAETAGRLNNFIMLFTLITVVFNSDGEIRVESDWITRHPVAGEFASLGAIGIISFTVFYSVKWSLGRRVREFFHPLGRRVHEFLQPLGRRVREFFQPSELDAPRPTGLYGRHDILSRVEAYKFLTRQRPRLYRLKDIENSPSAEDQK